MTAELLELLGAEVAAFRPLDDPDDVEPDEDVEPELVVPLDVVPLDVVPLDVVPLDVVPPVVVAVTAVAEPDEPRSTAAVAEKMPTRPTPTAAIARDVRRNRRVPAARRLSPLSRSRGPGSLVLRENHDRTACGPSAASMGVPPVVLGAARASGAPSLAHHRDNPSRMRVASAGAENSPKDP
ncbi:MAG: hypothetical protein ACQSGP_12805 [Frankia sp.]